MTLEQGYFITQIIGGIVLILSIIFLALQVRQNSALLQRQLTEDRRLSEQWLYEQVAGNQEFAQLHKRIGEDYDNLSDIEKYRANWLAEKNLRATARTLVAKVEGHASEAEWLDTQNQIRFFANRKNMRPAWERVKSGLPPKARELFEKIANWK